MNFWEKIELSLMGKNAKIDFKLLERLQKSNRLVCTYKIFPPCSGSIYPEPSSGPSYHKITIDIEFYESSEEDFEKEKSFLDIIKD